MKLFKTCKNGEKKTCLKVVNVDTKDWHKIRVSHVSFSVCHSLLF